MSSVEEGAPRAGTRGTPPGSGSPNPDACLGGWGSGTWMFPAVSVLTHPRPGSPRATAWEVAEHRRDSSPDGSTRRLPNDGTIHPRVDFMKSTTVPHARAYRGAHCVTLCVVRRCRLGWASRRSRSWSRTGAFDGPRTDSSHGERRHRSSNGPNRLDLVGGIASGVATFTRGRDGSGPRG